MIQKQIKQKLGQYRIPQTHLERLSTHKGPQTYWGGSFTHEGQHTHAGEPFTLEGQQFTVMFSNMAEQELLIFPEHMCPPPLPPLPDLVGFMLLNL